MTAALANLIDAPGSATTEPHHQVFAWIVAGAAEHEITQAIEHLWPDSKPKPLIIAAMKRIAAAAEVERDCLVGWCIEATRTVFQRSLEAGDHSAALRAIRQLYELAGRNDK